MEKTGLDANLLAIIHHSACEYLPNLLRHEPVVAGTIQTENSFETSQDLGTANDSFAGGIPDTGQPPLHNTYYTLKYCGRIRCCADMIGGSLERDRAQRTAKRYDDDGDGQDDKLRLMLLLDAVIEAARRTPPPQTNKRPIPKTRRTGRE